MSLRTPCAWAERPREGCGLGTGRHPLKRKQWWFRCRVGERLSCKPQLFLQTRFTSYIKAEFWHFFPKAVKREETISKKSNRLTQQVFNLMATLTRASAESSKIKASSKEQNLQRSSPKLSPLRVNFRHQVLAEGRLCTFTLFCAVWPGVWGARLYFWELSHALASRLQPALLSKSPQVTQQAPNTSRHFRTNTSTLQKVSFQIKLHKYLSTTTLFSWISRENNIRIMIWRF